MKNLVNQIIEEINKSAIEKEKKDKEYINTVMEIVNNITGVYRSTINKDSDPSIIYPYLYRSTKTGEIKIVKNFSPIQDMYDSEIAIKTVIKYGKEKEFLHWLTAKALPTFIIGESTAPFSYA